MTPFFSEVDVTHDLVHRARQEDVFISRFATVSERSWKTAIRIAVDHERMPPPGLPLPTLIALEVIRQSLFLTFHQGLNIAMDWHFITLESTLAWVSRPPLRESATYDGILEIDLHSIRKHKDLPRQLEFEMRLLSENEPVATATMNALALSSDAYNTLRKRSPEPRSEDVEHSLPQSEECEHEVHWDGNDKFLFRRASDHVVSMALNDAFIHGATQIRAESEIRSIATKFPRFTERDLPICLNTEQTETSFRGQFVQQKNVVADGAITWRSRSPQTATS